MAGTALPTAPISDVRCGISGRQRLVQIAGRYSLSALGPIAVSGAHFGASLMFLHRMSPREFGMFSFLLVVVPFCLSISSGLLGAPLLNAVGKTEAVAQTKGAAFREVNRFYCLSAGLLTALLMYFSGAGKVAVRAARALRGHDDVSLVFALHRLQCEPAAARRRVRSRLQRDAALRPPVPGFHRPVLASPHQRRDAAERGTRRPSIRAEFAAQSVSPSDARVSSRSTHRSGATSRAGR